MIIKARLVSDQVSKRSVILQGEQNSKYFCGLSSKVSKEYKYLIFLNPKAQLNNGLVVVPEAVELIVPILLGNKGGASTMSREVRPTSIKQSLGKGAVETSKNGCLKDKPQGQHGSSLMLKDIGTKKRK